MGIIVICVRSGQCQRFLKWQKIISCWIKNCVRQWSRSAKEVCDLFACIIHSFIHGWKRFLHKNLTHCPVKTNNWSSSQQNELTLDVLFNVIVIIEALNEALLLLLLLMFTLYWPSFVCKCSRERKRSDCGIITNELKREAFNNYIVHVQGREEKCDRSQFGLIKNTSILP